VDFRALRRLFRHYKNASGLGAPGDSDWSQLVNHEVTVAGGSRLGAAGDEVMLIASQQMTQQDIQRTVNCALRDARCSSRNLEQDSTGLLRWNLPHELVHRPPAQLKSAFESEWFVRITLRAHDLILLTRREKEVLQRRPALLELVRKHCLDGDESQNEGKAVADEPERQARMAANARARTLWAEREAALLTQVIQNSNKDEDMSPADSSSVTPLCNSLAS